MESERERETHTDREMKRGKDAIVEYGNVCSLTTEGGREGSRREGVWGGGTDRHFVLQHLSPTIRVFLVTFHMTSW